MRVLCLTWVCWLGSLAAQASSLPAADLRQFKFSLGSGPSVSVQRAWPTGFSLGGSLALPWYYGDFATIGRYDLHLQYPLLREPDFMISALAGVFGELNLRTTPTTQEIAPLGFEMGACFSYLFSEQWRIRLNLVPGFYLTLPPVGWTFLGSASGFELAWQPLSQLELTLGFNGNGDLFALSALF
jgi:hypothetical protein